MKIKHLILLPILILLISTTSALITTIDVKTLPYHTVIMQPLETGSGFTGIGIQPLKGFTGKYGDVRFEIEIDRSYFDLNFIIKDGETVVYREKTNEAFLKGSLVKVEILPEGVEPLEKPEEEIIIVEEKTNETINETQIIEEVIIEPTEEKNNILTNGYSIIQENKPVVNTIYYSILGMTALFLIFFTIKKNTKKIDKKTSKPLELDEDEELNQELTKTKEKLKELEEKRKIKIDAARKKLIEDEKELMKLRGKELKNPEEKDLKKELEDSKKKD